jgi:hypothetical protein
MPTPSFIKLQPVHLADFQQESVILSPADDRLNLLRDAVTQFIVGTAKINFTPDQSARIFMTGDFDFFSRLAIDRYCITAFGRW